VSRRHLHRRRSVIVVLDADGSELWTRRIDNDPSTLGLEIEDVPPGIDIESRSADLPGNCIQLE
jgi:hypothetical protein